MRTLILLCVVIGSVSSCEGDTPSDERAARQQAWQKSLDRRARFQFKRDDSSVIYSLSQFNGDCQIAMDYDPKKRSQLVFHIQRDGMDLATVVGHTSSVFVGKKGTFYFARYPKVDCGCRVIAFDTTTGAKRWEKQLEAAGEIEHSSYSNRVTMRLAPDTPSGQPATNPSEWHSLVITGSEGAGNYVEVIDTETGAELAHRVFR